MTRALISNLATTIKTRRIALGLAQIDVAEQLYISLRTFQRIESGESSPSIEVLVLLSEKLKFDLSEVFRYRTNVPETLEILQQNSRFLEMASRSERVGCFGRDLINKNHYWSDFMRDLFEVEPDFQPTLEKVYNFYKPGASRDKIKAGIEKLMQDGTPMCVEVKLITGRGRELDVIVRTEPEFLNGKVIRFFGTVQDITERNQHERQLERALNELNEIQNFAGFGRFERNLKTHELKWSDSIYKVFEIDPTTFDLNFQTFLTFVHPEDREELSRAYQRSNSKNSPAEHEYRIILPDGRVKWIYVQLWTEFDNEGYPARSVGYAFDQTRFKNKR